MSEIKDTREETKSRRWLAIYGAMIAAQVMEERRLRGEFCNVRQMFYIMEEAAAVADLEVEAADYDPF